MKKKKTKLDKAAREFLNLRLDLCGMAVSKEEIYETDRY